MTFGMTQHDDLMSLLLLNDRDLDLTYQVLAYLQTFKCFKTILFSITL
jgi:hypothetical protein